MSPRCWLNKSKNQFLVLSDHAYVKESYFEQNQPEFNNPKHYFDIELDRLMIEEERQLLRYDEHSDKLEDKKF